MQNSLRDKTVRGVGWSFIDNIASSGITFLIGLILARLLTPEEYGVMAMITIFIAISNSIVDSGFSNALIRKVNINRIDFNTVFYFNILISIILYFFLFFASPAISNFFGKSILIDIMRIIGFVLIINALSIIPRTIFVRNVNFKVQTKVSLISSIGSGVIGIGMALSQMGVWSLVGQQLSRQLLNTLFLWVYCKWRPNLEFSFRSFKELFGFGSKLLLSGLINTIYQNIYYIVIGRFYLPSFLGQYTRAEQFNTIFSNNLTTVVQRVSYPVLSSIQEDAKRLREGYRKIIKTTMLISFACMLGLAAIAKPLIFILIGEKWAVAAYFLQIICFAGMLYPLHAINLNILQVKGRSDLFLKLEIIKKLVAIIPIVLGIYYGIDYMLYGSVFTSFVSYFLNSYYSAGLINYSVNEQLRDIFPAFFVSLVVSIFMWSLSFINCSVYLLLPIQLLLGIVLLLIIHENLKMPEYLDLKRNCISLLKRI